MKSICPICGLQFQGKKECNAYKSIREGNYTITKCFNDHPVDLWTILTNVDTYLALRDPTPQEVKFGSSQCELFCKKFPLHFPEIKLTRKMIELSLVMPKFIRTKPLLVNVMFRLEQEWKHLHKLLNDIERNMRNILNREERYYKMIKEYENKVYCSK